MRGLEQIPWLYDALAAFHDWSGFEPWRRWLAGGARGRTLDLGCGTGRNLRFFAGNVSVVGLDPSREALGRARRRAPRAHLVLGRAEALPFRTGSFETVLTGLVLCSVEDPARALGEIARVLRPGGEFRALEHVRATAPWRARLQDAIQPLWTAVTGGCHPNRNTERAVAAAGFRIDTEERRAKGPMRRFVARLAG